MTIVFVNTRAQAELMFQALWRLNEPTLPIALHHGSLEVEQRRRVEAAMAAGKLRAVVATSSLDLGIDWGGVDQVIQVGAPKGVSRLLQRVGRANHRMDEARARSWCRPTASRCWNARPPCSVSPRANWMAIRRAPAGWTCWRSICWAWRARRRSGRTMYIRKYAAPRPTPTCRARTSTMC